MQDLLPVALVGALVYTVINFLKLVTNRQWSGVATQVCTWLGGVIVVVIASRSSFGPSVNVAGVALSSANAADLALIGLSASSLFSAFYDVKRAIDNTDSASTPPLLPSPQTE